MSQESLRAQLEKLLPVENPEKPFVILSLANTSAEKYLEADLILEIFAERRVRNFVYHGVHSTQAKVNWHVARTYPSNIKLSCKDITQLNPADIGSENNAVDLVILRHPCFELFLPSDPRYQRLSVDDMVNCFTSDPIQTAQRIRKPYLIAATQEDVAWMSLNPENAARISNLNRNLIGVFRKIIESTIPRFLAEEGKLFATCYQKQELAAVIYLSRPYSRNPVLVFNAENTGIEGSSKIDGKTLTHYPDGYCASFTRKPLLELNVEDKARKHEAKYGDCCGCGFFGKVARWVGIVSEEKKLDMGKVKKM